MYRGYFYGDYMWWLMPLFHVLGFIIFIAVVSLVVRGIFGGGKICPKDSETPLDILKKRYAKGEITREEFHRMKDDINN